MSGPRPSLALHIQRRLQRLYALDDLPPVDDFAHPCANDEREQVLLRQGDDAVDLSVRLPPAGLRPPSPTSLDTLCQIVEGVSHFVYLALRIQQELPSTQLELELQAEVDKFALLALGPLLKDDRETVWKIHNDLYDRVSFAHENATEEGRRYRLASALAARFWARIGARPPAVDATLRRLRAFYRAGQADKLSMALAA